MFSHPRARCQRRLLAMQFAALSFKQVTMPRVKGKLHPIEAMLIGLVSYGLECNIT